MFGRKLRCVALAACLALPLLGGPVLTTIQDVIYLANGTPYNGIAVITWMPFTAGDTSQIATQNVTVTITNGNLMVELVPNTNATPPGYYSVTYTSAGNDQFTETWNVPPSIRPLRVQDVLNSPSAFISGNPPITESQVVGLLTDLASRPLMGPSYANGRVALIDSTGLLEAVYGNTSDCVHVDGSTGPCGTSGSAGPNFTDAEIPGGAVNGSNTAFTVVAPPQPASSLALYRNGVLQHSGSDFTLSGNTIQFTTGSTPQPGDTLLASYRLTPAGTTQGPPVPAVLCSGTGTATSATTLTNLGTCTIPAATLQSGDRVKISFDYSHEGTLTGFTFTVNWGNTLLIQRNGAVADASISGRAEAGASPSFSQLSVQSWGTVLGFAASVLDGYDSLSFPIVLNFQAEMAASTTDTVTLRNFTVVRDQKTP